MNKLITLYLLTGWLSLSCAAQGGGMQRQNGGMLESAHIAYLTRTLNLSPAESERFWPVYNLYITEIRQARMAYKVHGDELRMEEVLLDIKKKYYAQFSAVLSSPQRANEFFRAEKEFGNFVQKELLQRRQMRMQGRRPLMGPGGDTP
jgi:hypothetical protein